MKAQILEQTLGITIALGALTGVGLFIIILSAQPQPQQAQQKQAQVRLSQFRARGRKHNVVAQAAQNLGKYGICLVLGFAAWQLTGWPVAAVLGALTGWAGPRMRNAPKQREQITKEIEAYSQWSEQLRDLVKASGSLYEAVLLSAGNSPPMLRPAIIQMCSIARTVGLPAALEWFVDEMDSPFADRLVLGMRISWDSGARVAEAFERVSLTMRSEVELRRHNEVGNRRAWVQVTSILGVTLVSVVGMFALNRGFFDPFDGTTGQVILSVAGGMIFGNVFWVTRLSETDKPIRLLSGKESAAGGEATESALQTAAAATSARPV